MICALILLSLLAWASWRERRNARRTRHRSAIDRLDLAIVRRAVPDWLAEDVASTVEPARLAAIHDLDRTIAAWQADRR